MTLNALVDVFCHNQKSGTERVKVRELLMWLVAVVDSWRDGRQRSADVWRMSSRLLSVRHRLVYPPQAVDVSRRPARSRPQRRRRWRRYRRPQPCYYRHSACCGLRNSRRWQNCDLHKREREDDFRLTPRRTLFSFRLYLITDYCEFTHRTSHFTKNVNTVFHKKHPLILLAISWGIVVWF